MFDVLGEALSGAELRRLLLDAIRYGDDPTVRDRINQVIDETVRDRIRNAIERPPLAEETMAFADVERIRLEMQEAAARRLQPHYIRAFFDAALTHLGGKLVEREPGRYQITSVPASIRQRDRQIGHGAPVLTRYERVTFDKELVRQSGAPLAELIAPGHPLLTATIDLILERHRGLFTQGTVLIDDADQGTEPRVLVMLEHAIADGRPTRTQPHTVVSRRFEFVEIDGAGTAVTAGYAPYLDYRPPTDAEATELKSLLDSEWLDQHLGATGTGPCDRGRGPTAPGEGPVAHRRSRGRPHGGRQGSHDARDQLLGPPRERAAVRADAGKTPQSNAPEPDAACHPSYEPCVPIAPDVDCAGGSGDGPEYTGQVRIIGSDEYGLMRTATASGARTIESRASGRGAVKVLHRLILSHAEFLS